VVKTKMIDVEPRKQKDLETFGPTLEDRVNYKELLERLDHEEKPGFEPMFNAESVSEGLDHGTLVLPISQGEKKGKYLKERHLLGFAQQRYVAGALGFRVGPNHFDDNNTVSADMEYPDATTLPERPVLQKDGSFLQGDGTPLSQLRADAINAAHFIASHPAKFKQPGAFQGVFEKIRKGAISGTISINPKTFPDDPEGAQAFIRQAARLMGHNVDDFQVVDDEDVEMIVKGARKGFDSTKTSFFKATPESLVDDLDRDRLRELTEQVRQPFARFGKEVVLTEHDRFQFDLIAKAARGHLEPFKKEDQDWKDFERLVHKNPDLISFAHQEGTFVPGWCIDGGENAAVKEVSIQAASGGDPVLGIQVPSKVFNAFHWQVMVENLEVGFRDYSNDTLEGRSTAELGKILQGVLPLVKDIQKGKK
jgi:hypothetical protein